MGHAFFIFLHIIVGISTLGGGLIFTIPVHLIYSAIVKKNQQPIVVINQNDNATDPTGKEKKQNDTDQQSR